MRGILEIPILGIEDPLLWGIWSSLSKKSDDHYTATEHAPEPGTGYFGYVCNTVPGYPDTGSLHASVRPQPGNRRPLIELHETDHPLYAEFSNGISVERAQQLAQLLNKHSSRSATFLAAAFALV